MNKEKDQKLIIYQVFPRIMTNVCETCVPDGTLKQNGSGKMNDFTPNVLNYIKELGVNCIWYTGIIEHATKTSFDEYGIPADNANVVKGEAGSPYAIKDYYDVAPSLAVDVDKRMEEFEALVRRTHEAGMKVMIDFVPNHTARVYHSDNAPAGIRDFGSNDDITKHFAPNNNYYYITNQLFAPNFNIGGEPEPYREFPAKATGNDCFTAFCNETDWYETAKLNYGHDYGDGSDHFNPVPDTWMKMLNILRFWVKKGVDGFRCDMAFMVPAEFWHWAIPKVREIKKDVIFVAEIYDVKLYDKFLNYCGFDYLYDKVNLYDTLVGIEKSGVSSAQLTYCWQTVEGMEDRMLNFLENHDEVRFASKAYANDPSKVIPSLAVSLMMSRGAFMLYYGQEIGEAATENEGFAGYNNRSTIFDYWSYDTLRRYYNGGKCDGKLLTPQETWLRNTYKRLITLCHERDELRLGNLYDLTYANIQNPGFNPHRHFAFFRYYGSKILLIVVNFDEKESDIAIRIPSEAFPALGLPAGTVEAIDLYDFSCHTLGLSPDEPISVTVGGHNALVLSFDADEVKK